MILIEENFNDIDYPIEEANDGNKKMYMKGVFMEAGAKNRNGRTYSLDEMRKEVDKINVASQKGNHILGELDHPCFHGETEVLTDEGWKRFYDLRGDEKVYSLNPDTKELEESPIHEVHDYDFNGEMIRIKNRTFDTLVTPNHKFLVYHSTTGKKAFITAEEIFHGVNNQIKGIGKWYIPRRNNGLIKDNEQTFVVPGVSSENFPINQNRNYMDDVHVDFNDFCEFLGIYLAEGCTKKTKNAYYISVYQNEGDTADYIREIISKFPFKFGERKIKGREHHIEFWCTDRRLGEYLKPLGINFEKYIPENIIQNLDKSAADCLLKGFIAGDGRGSPITQYKYCDAFSCSYDLVEDLSRVATIAGHSLRFYTEICEEDYIFADHVIEAQNKRPMYFIKILNSKGTFFDTRSLSVTKEKFNDKVYCISANYSNFVVRDGGYTFVTGNSGSLEVSLKNASHKITEMWMEGNQAFGKAEVLEKTTNGQILKGLIDSDVKVGMSSRASGKVKESGQVENFNLVTIDAVATPSAYNAYPESIYESLEMYKNGHLIEELAEAVMEDEKAQEHFRKELQNFIRSLRND